MPKLQQVKRANGSVVHSVNLPLEAIEELGWKKGVQLTVEVNTDNLKHHKIILYKDDEYV